jgi:hypothetical protein
MDARYGLRCRRPRIGMDGREGDWLPCDGDEVEAETEDNGFLFFFFFPFRGIKIADSYTAQEQAHSRAIWAAFRQGSSCFYLFLFSFIFLFCFVLFCFFFSVRFSVLFFVLCLLILFLLPFLLLFK